MNFYDLCIVLEKIGVDTSALYPRTPTQVQIPCPLAPWFHPKKSDAHPSVSIQFGIADKPTLWKCFACHECGKLADLVDSVGRLSEQPELVKLGVALLDSDKPSLSSLLSRAVVGIDDWVKPRDVVQASAIHASVLERFPAAWDDIDSRNYLKLRRVTEDEAFQHNLRYDTDRCRVVFPVYDTAREYLVGAVGRALGKEEPRYFNYFGFAATKHMGGAWAIDKSRGRLLVVEGFFCLINAMRHCPKYDADAVCTWKAEMSAEHASQLLRHDKGIYIGYDWDDAGIKGTAKAFELLKYNAGVVRRPRFDAGLDVDKMTSDQVGKLFA